jgi:hypothetical protein
MGLLLPDLFIDFPTEAFQSPPKDPKGPSPRRGRLPCSGPPRKWVPDNFALTRPTGTACQLPRARGVGMPRSPMPDSDVVIFAVLWI